LVYQHVLLFFLMCVSSLIHHWFILLVSLGMCRGSAVCFAFGQTGAGKTHTLLGNRSEPGLYQLAAADLFTLAASSKSHGSLHVWTSYYEIYCGHLYDLLNKRKRFEKA